MPLDPVTRNMCRVLLRKAAALDALPATRWLRSSPWQQALLSDPLRKMVMEWDTWDNAPDMVRTLVRRSPSQVHLGFEAARVMSVYEAVANGPAKPFAVGDVVRHHLSGDVGVVIAIHPSCQQPDNWIAMNVGSLDNPSLQEPWYDVLLDMQHGGFPRHGAGRNHERVSQEVLHPRLVEWGWVYDEEHGCYRKPS
eukprot:TRINITY_DN32460_c0_g1_i1.p1 TRINITY_DN32460_c0_g1~~TRINITY_DN32460_c0_g1_i1.p1  ORF type:complete len:195 (+),score=37.02 TRINITY_DN32460_c0_g1_i1:98-682(+)